MILSSSACSVPRNHAHDVNCDFINDAMDFTGSNNPSESSLSPSLTLQSPPPYKTPSYEFPIQPASFATDDDVATAFDDVTTSLEAIPPATTDAVTTNRTNAAQSLFCTATSGNNIEFLHRATTLATSATAVLPSPPTFQTRSFSVGASNMPSNNYLPVHSDNPPRYDGTCQINYLYLKLTM